jgi:hypothetical protein
MIMKSYMQTMRILRSYMWRMKSNMVIIMLIMMSYVLKVKGKMNGSRRRVYAWEGESILGWTKKGTCELLNSTFL